MTATDEQLIKAVEGWRQLNAEGVGKMDAWQMLGYTSRGSFDNMLRRAAERGLDGSVPYPAAQGFRVKQNSVQYDKRGIKKGQAVKFGPDADRPFELPAGHNVKGVSALLDASGLVTAQWVKTSAGQRPPEQIAADFEAAFTEFKPAAPVIPKPATDEHRLTVYICSDWHVGMLAYAPETDGRSFDLSIAIRELGNTFRELVEQSPPSKHAIILGLGDLVHIDNAKGLTPMHGNMLDFDSRYSKIVTALCDLFAELTQLVAAKHEHVEIVLKEGNHDTDTTVGLRCALRAWFRENKRVSVDMVPSPFYLRRFGVNLIGAVHGDKTKMAELPLLMAVMRPSDWAQSKTRHWHTGHFHHLKTVELNGVVVHQHRAPIPPDAFHASRGYRSGQSMRAFHYHEITGFRSLTEIEIQ